MILWVIVAFILGFGAGFWTLVAAIVVSDWMYERAKQKRRKAEEVP